MGIWIASSADHAHHTLSISRTGGSAEGWLGSQRLCYSILTWENLASETMEESKSRVLAVSRAMCVKNVHG